MEIAAPNDFAGGTTVRVLAVAVACLALVNLMIGAFTLITGRRWRPTRQQNERTGKGTTRRLGLSQVLSAAGVLIIGLQPFLHLTWLSRTVLLAFAVALTVAGAALMAMTFLRLRHQSQ